MSDNSKNISDNQEIDLSHISERIGDFFENISTRIFRGILFLKRNLLVIGALFILGAGLGFYFDRTSKSYSNNIIVLPNFESTDYLYSKILLIESKIKEKDSIFLKDTLGIKESSKLKKISIAPIVDIYKFINSGNDKEEDKNFELLRLIAEDGDFNKVVKQDLTSKNYPYHTITIETHDKADYKVTIKPILKYLNNSAYFKKNQKVYLDNTKIKIAQNDSIILEIDGLLNTFSNRLNSSKSDKLVYYNENTQLDEVIKIKDELNKEQGQHRMDLANYDKIIKDITTNINVRNINGANSKMKFLLPILFVFLFILGGIIKSFYRRQLAKLHKQNMKGIIVGDSTGQTKIISHIR